MRKVQRVPWLTVQIGLKQPNWTVVWSNQVSYYLNINIGRRGEKPAIRLDLMSWHGDNSVHFQTVCPQRHSWCYTWLNIRKETEAVLWRMKNENVLFFKTDREVLDRNYHMQPILPSERFQMIWDNLTRKVLVRLKYAEVLIQPLKSVLHCAHAKGRLSPLC